MHRSRSPPPPPPRTSSGYSLPLPPSPSLRPSLFPPPFTRTSLGYSLPLPSCLHPPPPLSQAHRGTNSCTMAEVGNRSQPCRQLPSRLCRPTRRRHHPHHPARRAPAAGPCHWLAVEAAAGEARWGLSVPRGCPRRGAPTGLSASSILASRARRGTRTGDAGRPACTATSPSKPPPGMGGGGGGQRAERCGPSPRLRLPGKDPRGAYKRPARGAR